MAAEGTDQSQTCDIDYKITTKKVKDLKDAGWHWIQSRLNHGRGNRKV
jgi:hypothetical protein